MTDAVTTNHIDGVLRSLPGSATVAVSGNARLVMTHTGIFVVVPATIDIVTTADRAHWLATETRDVLATHLSWVPFVDAVVVSGERLAVETMAATVVPLDLLGDVLREGVNVIDATLLAKLCTLLSEDCLAKWNTGTRPEDDTIDLCNPMVPTIEI